MARPKKPKDASKNLNPTGKGGLGERPHDIRQDLGVAALIEKAEEKKVQKALLFRDEQELFKQNLRTIALFGTKEDGVRAKDTKDILDYIAQGNPEKILEKSDTDEFGTVDDKLKQVSDEYLKTREENKELKRRLAQIEQKLGEKGE